MKKLRKVIATTDRVTSSEIRKFNQTYEDMLDRISRSPELKDFLSEDDNYALGEVHDLLYDIADHLDR